MISVTTGGLKGGQSPTMLKKNNKKNPGESAPLDVLPADGMRSSAHYKYTRPLCRLRPHSIHVEPALTCWPRPLKHPPLLLKQDCLFLYEMSCTEFQDTHLSVTALSDVTHTCPCREGGACQLTLFSPTEQDQEESEDVDPRNLYLA